MLVIEVRAAHDFGDLHRGVIDRAGELVAGQVVLSPDEEVAEIAPATCAPAAQRAVGEGYRLAVGHAKAPVHAGARAVGRSSAAGAGIKWFLLARRAAP